MQIRRSECQLAIEWTLPICVRKADATGVSFVHVHDLDATLEIAYWEVEDRDYEWEIRSAEIDGLTVDETTDAAMWSIVMRGVTFHHTKIHEHVNDIIRFEEAA